MTSAWDQATEMAHKHASTDGFFVRLTNNGDKVVGAFCGDPLPREVVWTGERYEKFDPEVHKGKRPSLRVMLNFYVPAERAMKVIEGGSVWFKDVAKLRTKYGLERWLFEIERHGEAGDPKTKYSILPEEQLSEAQLEEIASLELFDLASLAGGEEEDDPDDALIDVQVAEQIVGRLRPLPRSAATTFLEQFQIQRIRDLPRSRLTEARRLLDALEARHRPMDPSIDPFG